MSARPDSRRPGWSIPVARVFGIPVRVHATFLLLPAIVGSTARIRGEDAAAALVLVGLTLACVLLHELGHAAVGLRRGIRPLRVTLYPTGGIVWFSEVPDPRAEWRIAVAGPAVNAGIAIALATAIATVHGPDGFFSAVPERSFLGAANALLWINLSLAAFNLFPAYPMDGGRIVRAALALRWGSRRATSLAATIGQGLAVVLAAVGLATRNPWFGIVAGVVFVGARQQARAERPPETVDGPWAREAMLTTFAVLDPGHLLTEAACRAAATAQEEFPVVDREGTLRGVLLRPSIYHGVHFRGPTGRVGDEMDTDVTVATADSDLLDVLTPDHARTGRPILVVEDGRLIGMIPAARVREYAEIDPVRSTGPRERRFVGNAENRA